MDENEKELKQKELATVAVQIVEKERKQKRVNRKLKFLESKYRAIKDVGKDRLVIDYCWNHLSHMMVLFWLVDISG